MYKCTIYRCHSPYLHYVYVYVYYLPMPVAISMHHLPGLIDALLFGLASELRYRWLWCFVKIEQLAQILSGSRSDRRHAPREPVPGTAGWAQGEMQRADRQAQRARKRGGWSQPWGKGGSWKHDRGQERGRQRPPCVVPSACALDHRSCLRFVRNLRFVAIVSCYVCMHTYVCIRMYTQQ